MDVVTPSIPMGLYENRDPEISLFFLAESSDEGLSSP